MLNQYHASFQPSEDSGQYRCTARNERGEVSLAMSLEVNTDIAVGELHSMTGWRNEVPKRVSKDGIHFILSILDGI